ncbi:MAG: adenylosuccinate synthase [Bacillales bacterium]|jgi:adenylosuccinate synthase|nr:adenylosuccinate synthase [Bacillales bacterium]
MNRIVIVGSQWGDEGKGKITDYLASKADVVVRYQGGNNAGHTVQIKEKKYFLHLLPSGVLRPNVVNILANGMVINPLAFKEELENINKNAVIFVSNRAHIVLPIEIFLDGSNESRKTNKIGTTNRGIGPTYEMKASRIGLRVVDFIDPKEFKNYLDRLYDLKGEEFLKLGFLTSKEDLYKELLPYAHYLKPFVTDSSLLLNKLIQENKKVLFEGAQGVMLCLDHGTYPYVTSSSPTAASVPLNTGIAPWLVEGSIGVCKAYTTRVGNGPFPSEILSELASIIREKGHEYGVTTKRPRRIGWLDTVALRYAKNVSGLSYLAITLLDVLSGLKEIKVVKSYTLKGVEIDYVPASLNDFQMCKPNYIVMNGWQENIENVRSFKELPIEAQDYLKLIEKLSKTPIAIFSVGPAREQTITLKDIFND